MQKKQNYNNNINNNNDNNDNTWKYIFIINPDSSKMWSLNIEEKDPNYLFTDCWNWKTKP